jgi:hypothetical protein
MRLSISIGLALPGCRYGFAPALSGGYARVDGTWPTSKRLPFVTVTAVEASTTTFTVNAAVAPTRT